MQDWEIGARIAIADLVVRYNSNGDTGRFDNVMELFAPDAVMEGNGKPRHGRDEIRTIFTGAADGFAGKTGTAPRHVRHTTGTLQIDLIDETSATGRCYFQVLTQIGLDHWGRYVDSYRVIDGKWRFASRKVSIDGQSPNSVFPTTS
jgi:uncharacterized protein (TIGR02246 family)